MIAEQAIPPGETGSDQMLGFTIPLRHARGRVVRLDPLPHGGFEVLAGSPHMTWAWR